MFDGVVGSTMNSNTLNFGVLRDPTLQTALLDEELMWPNLTHRALGASVILIYLSRLK